MVADSAGAAVVEWVVATMGVEGMATGGYGFGGFGLGYGLGYGMGYGYGYPGYGYGYGYSSYGLGYSGYGYGSYPGYGYGSGYSDPGYTYSSAYGTVPLQATPAAPSFFSLPSLGIDEKAVSDASGSRIQVVRVHPGSPAEHAGLQSRRHDRLGKRLSDPTGGKPRLDHQSPLTERSYRPDRPAGCERTRRHAHCNASLTGILGHRQGHDPDGHSDTIHYRSRSRPRRMWCL